MRPRLAFIQKSAYEKISFHYLAGALREQGYEYDLFIEDLEPNFYSVICKYDPDYILYSLFIGEEHHARKSLHQLRQKIPHVKTLVGGPFTVIFPEIVKSKEVDYVFRGDGEIVLPQFLDQMASGSDLSDIPGILYKDDSGAIQGNDNLRLVDLNKIPAPDRNIYYKYDFLRNKSTKVFIAARGCPYKCSYCYNSELSSFFPTRYWRTRSVEDVLSEITYVKNKYGLSWVHFQDGTFNADLKWLERFLEAYKLSGLPPFLCNCRAERLNEDIIIKMKSAGCNRVTLGLQSGNKRVRQELAGRNMSDNHIIQASRLCKKHGIRVGVDIIFGWPGETFEEAMDTIRLCREIDADSYSSNVLIFFPGLRITKYAVENNFISQEPSLEETDCHHSNSSLLVTQHKNLLINLDKWFNWLIRYPKMEPLILKFLSISPNKFFSLIKNIHLLQRTIKYEIEQPKIKIIRSYLKRNLETGIYY